MWRSKYCQGEKCFCGNDAVAKIGEEIFEDEPNPIRHNLTAYICEDHFRMVFGDRGVDFMEQIKILTPFI